MSIPNEFASDHCDMCKRSALAPNDEAERRKQLCEDARTLVRLLSPTTVPEFLMVALTGFIDHAEQWHEEASATAPKQTLTEMVRDIDAFQLGCLRTWRSDATPRDRLAHAAIGVAEESGECLTFVKRHLFYGQPLDLENVRLEIGDLMFFACVLAHEAGLVMSDVLEGNRQKLARRYPAAWTAEDAAARKDEAAK